MDLDRFTRKLGPFPIYAWALAIVTVGYLAYKYVNRGAAASPATPTVTDTTPASTDTTAPDSSQGIGLASNGNTTPTHVIIDNPSPNMFTPTPVMPKPVTPTPVKVTPLPSPRQDSPSPTTPTRRIPPMPTTKPKTGYKWLFNRVSWKWVQVKA
jgi:hypothetical protein